MATGKKSFLMYCDLIHTIEKLSDENAGKLLKHLLQYVNDKNPIPENDYIDLVFEPIKQQLKRDLGDWEEKKTERSISGRMGNLKRWNLDLHIKVELNELTLEEAEIIAINRKTSLSEKNIAKVAVNVNDNVNVNVNVNDNVNDTVILLEKETKNKFVFRSALINYGFIENLVDDWLKVRKTKKATNTETAYNGFISQVEKSKKDKNEILLLCINKSWSGFNAEWLLNQTNTPMSNTQWQSKDRNAPNYKSVG